jgi:hypothetical protein
MRRHHATTRLAAVRSQFTLLLTTFESAVSRALSTVNPSNKDVVTKSGRDGSHHGQGGRRSK